jgi:hypothetical protein
MMIATLFLAALLLVVSPVVGGVQRLAAQSYDQSACQKYHSNWAASRGNFNE